MASLVLELFILASVTSFCPTPSATTPFVAVNCYNLPIPCLSPDRELGGAESGTPTVSTAEQSQARHRARRRQLAAAVFRDLLPPPLLFSLCEDSIELHERGGGAASLVAEAP
jgi:hypothetical protein